MENKDVFVKFIDFYRRVCYYNDKLYHTKNNLGYYDKVVHRKALTSYL